MVSSKYIKNAMGLVWGVGLMGMCCVTVAWADIAVPRPVVRVSPGQQDKIKSEKPVPPANPGKLDAAANSSAKTKPDTTQSDKPKSQVDKKNGNLESVDLQQKATNPKWDQPYLLAAYGVVWLVMMLYLVILVRRLTRTDSEIRGLEEQLNDLLPREKK